MNLNRWLATLFARLVLRRCTIPPIAASKPERLGSLSQNPMANCKNNRGRYRRSYSAGRCIALGRYVVSPSSTLASLFQATAVSGKPIRCPYLWTWDGRNCQAAIETESNKISKGQLWPDIAEIQPPQFAIRSRHGRGPIGVRCP